MKFYTFISFFVLLLFCSIGLHAQSKDYVYVDSSIMYADSINKIVEENNFDSPVEDEEVDTAVNTFQYIIDTNLVNNDLVLSRDSMRMLKNTKSFAYAKNLDSMLKALQQEQLKNKAAKSEPQTSAPSLFEKFLLSDITRIVFWIIGGFFVLFIIYKLFFTQGFLQRASAKTPVSVLTSEDAGEKLEGDYDKKIAHAVSNKNFRLATRYLYLQALQNLSEEEIIVFAADKTNSQYLYELHDKAYKGEFNSLTLNYEYVWYGEFHIDETVYNNLQSRFKKFNNQVKNS